MTQIIPNDFWSNQVFVISAVEIQIVHQELFELEDLLGQEHDLIYR